MTTSTQNPPPTPRELDLHLSHLATWAATLAQDAERFKTSADNLLAAVQTVRRHVKGDGKR